MRVLGISLKKGEIRYSVLEGSKAKPSLTDKSVHNVIEANSTPSLLDWFETTFEEIIAKTKPDKIGYKLLLSPKKQQLEYISYPEAILNLVAYKRKIAITSYTTGNFVASKFGLAKGVDLYKHCDLVFGNNPPKWDKDQKYSVIAAWLGLP